MNVVLIGYRCSGKTTAGKIIAKKMKRAFLDTDVMIQDKAGRSIAEIVSINGWEYFREIERDIIKDISTRDSIVVATGGGIVMDEGNVRGLKQNGFIVWLKGDIDVLKERMEKDDGSGRRRPSLTGEEPMDEIEKVLNIRNPLYLKAGDLVVDTSQLSVQEVADLILKELAKAGVN